MTNKKSKTHPAFTRLEQPVADRLLAYRSKLLSDDQSAAWTDDLRVAVALVPPTDTKDALALCSTAARFLADMAPPTALGLADVFTAERINRWLALAEASGRPFSTVKLARIRLEYIRRSLAGSPQRHITSTKTAEAAATFSDRLLTSMVATCSLAGLPTLAAFVACVGAGVGFDLLRGGSCSADGSKFVDQHGQTHRVVARWQELARSTCASVVDEAAALRLISLLPDSHPVAFEAQLHATFLAQVASLHIPLATTMRLYGIHHSQLGRMVATTLGQKVTDEQRRLLRDGSGAIAVCPATSTLGSNPPASGVSGGVRVKRLTASEMRRRAKRAAERGATVPEFSDVVRPLIEGYVPDSMDDATWQVVGPVLREVLARAEVGTVESFRKFRGALAAYLLWRHEHREGISLDVVMRASAIDDYVAHGMGEYSQKTRLDYRTRLDALARRVNPGSHNPIRLSMPRPGVQSGYTLAEEATLRRVALTQRSLKIRQRLCGFIGLGAGCGLDPSDLRQLYVRDVRDLDEDGIEVHVHGSKPRLVMVRRVYEASVRVAIAARRPNERVVGGSEADRAVTSRIVENADLWDSPNISAARLRTTWLSWLIQQPVPLALILDASGLRSAHTLSEIVALLPGEADANADLSYLRGEAL